MKFILPEYRLNEKYILKEKYVLAEADDLVEAGAQETINSLNSAITNSLDDLKTNLQIFNSKLNVSKKTSNTNAALNSVKDAADAVENTLKTPDYSNDQLISELSVFKQKFQNYLKLANIGNFTNNETNKINTTINALTKDLATAQADEKSIKKAILSFNALNSIIDKIAISDTFDAENQTINNIKTQLNEIANIIKTDKLGIDIDIKEHNKDSINEYIAALADSYKYIKAFNDKVKKNENISASTIKSIISNNIIENMLNAFNDISTSTISKAKATADVLNKEDWQARLNAAGADEEKRKIIWNEYFKDEWKEDAERVKSLGTNFTHTLLRYGFEGSQNVYVKYLKNAFERNLNVTFDSFRILRGAVENRWLCFQDLTLFGTNDFGCKGLLKEDNLIYRPQFYALSSTEMVNYLKEQAKLFANKNDNKTITTIIQNNDFLNTKYKSGNVEGIRKFFIDIFFEPGNISSEARGNINGELRSASKIDIILSKLGLNANIEQKEKYSIDNPQLKKAFENKENESRAGIFYLWQKYSKESLNTLNKYGINADYRIYAKDLATLKNVFKDININEQNVNTVIEDIAKLGGIIKNDKNNNQQA